MVNPIGRDELDVDRGRDATRGLRHPRRSMEKDQ